MARRFRGRWVARAAHDRRALRRRRSPHNRKRLHDGALLATSPRIDWAQLMRRTFDLDVLACPQCGKPTRIVAAITDAKVAAKILKHLGVPQARASPSGALDPLLDGDFMQ